MNRYLKKLLAKKPLNEVETQNQLIAKALLAGEKVTAGFALRAFGCFRLAAIIYNLRYEFQMGPRLITTYVRVNKRNGKKATIAEYTYKDKKRNK